MSKPHYEQIPFDGKTLLPLDKVVLKDGTEATVSSAHYRATDGGQMFSICYRGGKYGRDNDLYRADETTFVHRCIFKQYKNSDQYRCECGHFYTTMADFMARNQSLS